MGAEWIDQLGIEVDDSIKNDPTIQNYGSVQDLMKGHIETKAMVGRKGVLVPGKDAAPEEWDNFYTQLGRPKSPDEYQMSTVQMPEGYPEMDKNSIAEFRKQAHALGMNPQQVDGLWKWYAGSNAQAFQKMQESQANSMKETEAKMREELGDKYDATLSLAQKAGKYAFGEDFESFAEKHGNNPSVIKALAKIGSQLSEDQLGEGQGAGMSKTPEEAQAEINSIMADPKHPYHNEGPEHQAAVDHVSKLYETVYGGTVEE